MFDNHGAEIGVGDISNSGAKMEAFLITLGQKRSPREENCDPNWSHWGTKVMFGNAEAENKVFDNTGAEKGGICVKSC